MKKLMTTVLVVLGLLFCSMKMAIADNSNPVDMLHSLADEMVASLKAHQATLKSNPSLVYSIAYKVVVPHADLDEMAQRVLPPQTWDKATATQRAQFEHEFTTLLVHTYASALADYTDQTIRFFPIRGSLKGKTNITVNSQIVRSDGPPISVSYRLVLRKTGWQLYDMTVEGVSLLQSFQEQFRQKLSQGNIVELIGYLKQHNARRR
jgi:phospholipid transport system substrate-binding protein